MHLILSILLCCVGLSLAQNFEICTYCDGQCLSGTPQCQKYTYNTCEIYHDPCVDVDIGYMIATQQGDIDIIGYYNDGACTTPFITYNSTCDVCNNLYANYIPCTSPSPSSSVMPPTPSPTPSNQFQICKYCSGSCDYGNTECYTFTYNTCELYHDPCLDVDYGYMRGTQDREIVTITTYADATCHTVTSSFNATCDECLSAYASYVPCGPTPSVTPTPSLASPSPAPSNTFEICKYCDGTCGDGTTSLCETFTYNTCEIYHDPCLDIDYGYMIGTQNGEIITITNYADATCHTVMLSFHATCDECLSAYASYVPCGPAPSVTPTPSSLPPAKEFEICKYCDGTCNGVSKCETLTYNTCELYHDPCLDIDYGYMTGTQDGEIVTITNYADAACTARIGTVNTTCDVCLTQYGMYVPCGSGPTASPTPVPSAAPTSVPSNSFELCEYCSGSCGSGNTECYTYTYNTCELYHDPCLDIDYGYMTGTQDGEIITITTYADATCTTPKVDVNTTCNVCDSQYGMYVPCGSGPTASPTPLPSAAPSSPPTNSFQICKYCSGSCGYGNTECEMLTYDLCQLYHDPCLDIDLGYMIGTQHGDTVTIITYADTACTAPILSINSTCNECQSLYATYVPCASPSVTPRAFPSASPSSLQASSPASVLSASFAMVLLALVASVC